jgi:hypothetical protein
MLWGLWALPIFWHERSMRVAVPRIIAGRTIEPEALRSVLAQFPTLDSVRSCHAPALRGAAIIRLRLLEVAQAEGRSADFDSGLEALRGAVIQSLSCSPIDSFLWLVLFWIENTQKGFDADTLKFLRLSYQFGRNEGWIALRRNPAALAIYESLPSDLAEDALNEFSALLRAGLYNHVADILTGPGRHLQAVLLARVNAADQSDRVGLAHVLKERHIELEIEGIERRERRPWHE